MSTEIWIALIGAFATIVAAVIGYIAVKRSKRKNGSHRNKPMQSIKDGDGNIQVGGDFHGDIQRK